MYMCGEPSESISNLAFYVTKYKNYYDASSPLKMFSKHVAVTAVRLLACQMMRVTDRGREGSVVQLYCCMSRDYHCISYD